MKAEALKRGIMRRVYYSYAISIISHTMFWQGIFLSVAASLLAKWLFVARIVDSLLSVPVGRVPQFIFHLFENALAHGEVLMVATVLGVAVVCMSVGYKLAQMLLGSVVTMKV